MPFEWSPGIGDPTPSGWFTVVAYFVASWLCFRAFMAAKSGPPRPYGETIIALLRVIAKHWPTPPSPAKKAAVWLGLGVLLAALGFNKQLDLQTLFTEIGRWLAWNLGFYEARQVLQVVFIGAILFLSWKLLVGLIRFLGDSWGDLLLPLSGFAFLLAFVLIRAASFHGIDSMLGVSIGGISFNALLELPGIIIIGVSAARVVRKRRLAQR